MAMNGINLALAFEGQEFVWQNVGGSTALQGAMQAIGMTLFCVAHNTVTLLTILSCG